MALPSCGSGVYCKCRGDGSGQRVTFCFFGYRVSFSLLLLSPNDISKFRYITVGLWCSGLHGICCISVVAHMVRPPVSEFRIIVPFARSGGIFYSSLPRMRYASRHLAIGLLLFKRGFACLLSTECSFHSGGAAVPLLHPSNLSFYAPCEEWFQIAIASNFRRVCFASGVCLVLAA